MNPIDNASQPASRARTELARSLTQALESDDATLAGSLLQALDRADLLVSVKEVASGRYVHVNTRMAELFGRSAAAMVGAIDTELLEPARANAIRSAEQAALAAATPTPSEHRIERDGVKREFGVHRMALPRGDGGTPRHVLAVWVERTDANQRETQLQQALAQLEQQQIANEVQRREAQNSGSRDAASGLFQNSHFADQLRREVDLSSREHREFALVLIAIDPLNDAVNAQGVEARGRVFDALGRLLRGNTRAMDASCRLEDNRFAVLLSGVGLATAHSRMEGLRRQCATQIVVYDGRDLGFSVAMGVASFPHTAHTEDDLMSAARTALAEAQRRGGNHVALASIRFELGGA